MMMMMMIMIMMIMISVSLSVCLFVTFWCFVQTNEDTMVRF